MALARAIIDEVGNGQISIANIRAGVKGKLSPDSEASLYRRLKAQGEEDDD
jgi:hypothetical protein